MGSLHKGWTLSRLPGLLLLAQLLSSSGALRQDVLFLQQCLAQPPPVLIPELLEEGTHHCQPLHLPPA